MPSNKKPSLVEKNLERAEAKAEPCRMLAASTGLEPPIPDAQSS
jgi:hypothetical protein